MGEIELNGVTPIPSSAKRPICVKVINHFGDEVQKVFQV